MYGLNVTKCECCLMCFALTKHWCCGVSAISLALNTHILNIKYSLCLALFFARVKSHKSIFTQPLAAFLSYATLFSHALMGVRTGPPSNTEGSISTFDVIYPYVQGSFRFRAQQVEFHRRKQVSLAQGRFRQSLTLLWRGEAALPRQTRRGHGQFVSQQETEGWKIRVHPWDFTLTLSCNWLISVTLPG